MLVHSRIKNELNSGLTIFTYHIVCEIGRINLVALRNSLGWSTLIVSVSGADAVDLKNDKVKSKTGKTVSNSQSKKFRI